MGQQGLWLSGDVLAAAANQLRTHMANHLDARRDVLQHIRHLLPLMAKPHTATEHCASGWWT